MGKKRSILRGYDRHGRGEAGVEERYVYFLDLARSLPTIDASDPRIQGILSARTGEERSEAERPFGFYGHNFILIFQAMRARKINPESKLLIISGVLEPLEDLGKPWQRFLAGNGDLLAQIDVALGEQEPWRGLMEYHRDLIFDATIPEDRRKKMSADLLSAPNHPLGIDAVGYYYTDRINPLLRIAWTAMEKAGIDHGYTPLE